MIKNLSVWPKTAISACESLCSFLYREQIPLSLLSTALSVIVIFSTTVYIYQALSKKIDKIDITKTKEAGDLFEAIEKINTYQKSLKKKCFIPAITAFSIKHYLFGSDFTLGSKRWDYALTISLSVFIGAFTWAGNDKICDLIKEKAQNKYKY